MIIDKNLSWNEQIQHVSQKISKACGYLSKLRHCVNTDTLISVYYALVHSYLRYGIVSWGSATSTALQPLSSLVNRIVRIMTFAPFGNIDVNSIYKYLDVPKVSDIISIETGKLIFRKENDLLPVRDIANHFMLRNENVTHRYNLRNRNVNMSTIEYTSSFGEKSVQFRGAKLWNSLPEDLCNSQSMVSFKKKLKLYLLDESNIDDDDDIYFCY